MCPEKQHSSSLLSFFAWYKNNYCGEQPRIYMHRIQNFTSLWGRQQRQNYTIKCFLDQENMMTPHSLLQVTDKRTPLHKGWENCICKLTWIIQHCKFFLACLLNIPVVNSSHERGNQGHTCLGTCNSLQNRKERKLYKLRSIILNSQN